MLGHAFGKEVRRLCDVGIAAENEGAGWCAHLWSRAGGLMKPFNIHCAPSSLIRVKI
jgi:hypothetical protein